MSIFCNMRGGDTMYFDGHDMQNPELLWQARGTPSLAQARPSGRGQGAWGKACAGQTDLAESREGKAWAPITCTEHIDRGSSSTLATGQLWVLEALHPQAHPLYKGCSEGPASAHLLLLTSALSPKWETQFVDWSPVLIPDIGIYRGKANTQPTVCPWAGAPVCKLNMRSGSRLPSLPTTPPPPVIPKGGATLRCLCVFSYRRRTVTVPPHGVVLRITAVTSSGTLAREAPGC